MTNPHNRYFFNRLCGFTLSPNSLIALLLRTSFYLSSALFFRVRGRCAASYDGGVFPPMHAFLYKLGIKGYQSRRVGVVENGTWAPTAGKTICSMLEQMKNIDIISPILTIRSAWKEDYQQDLEALVKGVIREECM